MSTPSDPNGNYKHNPEHALGTCVNCGGEMVYNVPRLGPNGGYVHKATGTFNCERDPSGIEGERREHTSGLPEASSESGEATRQNTFISLFNNLAREVHANARAKGWWDTERNDGEMICLMHSELSEALEAIRNGNPADDKIPKFLGTEAELADVVIRIMDAAHARQWRVAEAIIAKIEMNKERPFKHGRKAF